MLFRVCHLGWLGNKHTATVVYGSIFCCRLMQTAPLKFPDERRKHFQLSEALKTNIPIYSKVSEFQFNIAYKVVSVTLILKYTSHYFSLKQMTSLSNISPQLMIYTMFYSGQTLCLPFCKVPVACRLITLPF